MVFPGAGTWLESRWPATVHKSTGGLVVEFGVLGPLAVADGSLADSTSRRARLSGERRVVMLLRLLLDAGSVVTTDALIDDVWGGSSPRDARGTLQSHASKLRGIIGRDRLVFRSGGYVLDLDKTTDRIDSDHFEAEVGFARTLLRDEEPGAALATLDQAMALWRGDAYAEASDRPWAAIEAARLSELHESSIDLRLEAMVHGGDFDDAIAAAEAAVADQPLREGRWAQLMIALARSGRQADALRAFQRVRSCLADELGIEPSPSLVLLEDAILRQRPDLTSPSVPTWTASERGDTPVAPAPQDDPTMPVLAAAGNAFGRGRWSEAFQHFAEAATLAPLDADGLESYADAAMYAGEAAASIAARQQLFAHHLRTGDRAGAAQAAIWLVINHVVRRQLAVAAGWFHKSRRLLADEPHSAAHGYLSMVEVLFGLATGELDDAHRAAQATFAAGEAFGDIDLEAMGLMCEGAVLVRQGDVETGVARLDEAMAMASSGGLGPFATGLIYCRTLCACMDVGDYRRAGEWLDALDWSDGDALGFPGDCRAHRADLLMVQGSWAEAEVEAELACSEAQRFDILHVGYAYNELGVLHLRRGSHDEAAAAFERARALDASAQPGQALLDLARGEPGVALRSIRTALDDEGIEPLARARLLPALIEIALAAGAVDEADEALAELEGHADRFGSAALRAAVVTGRAATADAEDQPRLWRDALTAWRDVGAPYERAVAQLRLASAMVAAGETDAGRDEARQAASVFESLGAQPNLERAAALLA